MECNNHYHVALYVRPWFVSTEGPIMLAKPLLVDDKYASFPLLMWKSSASPMAQLATTAMGFRSPRELPDLLRVSFATIQSIHLPWSHNRPKFAVRLITCELDEARIE